MHLISKIFSIATHVSHQRLTLQLQINPYFLENPARIGPWVAFFLGILGTSGGDALESPTESSGQIEELDKNEFWRLKGVVAHATHKLLSK